MWEQPVFDGHYHCVGFSCQSADEVVINRREGRLEDKPTAVEVEENGELLGGVVDLGKEDTGRNGGFGLNCDVLGLDTSDCVSRRGDLLCLVEYFYATVFVHPEEAKFTSNLVVDWLHLGQEKEVIGAKKFNLRDEDDMMI